MDANEIISSFDKAKRDRVVVENTWEDLLYYGMPRKRGINSQYEPGEKPSWDVYDDTAVQSNLIMAAGLSGYMTNASQRWFELRTRNEALMQAPKVKKFFNDCSDQIYATLAVSNFYQQIHEVYIDLGVLGTATMYEDEDVTDGVRFYARHPREIYIVEDDREKVTMVFRKFKMTAYQAYKFFGTDCGEAITKAVEEEKDFGKMFDFIQYVCPRHERDVRKVDNTNMPIASYWVSLADKKIVRESGFMEFPYFCPRFYKNSGETYGYSPAYTCFPEITMTNKAVETYIKAVEFAIYPPWITENDGILGTLDLRPGAINYQRQPVSSGQAVLPLNNKSNFQVGIDFINRSEEKIKRAFFVDLFLMLTQSKDMTATEVIERVQEKMLVLGPVLGRLQNELLNPIIYRTFNILLRRGMFPEVPQELQGQDWDVVYVSPLAKAQRAVQARDMQTFIAVITQMMGFAPTVADKLDTDVIVDKMSKMYSVDPDIIREMEDIQAIRQQRQQQQMEMARLQALTGYSGVAVNAGKATKDMANADAVRNKKS